jgi:prepilin-type N-terminal cleavage/methylation domain-containing protein
MTKMTSTRQSGFTLLELLLVIGVAALLLIGGIATYRLVSDGNKATETSRLLLTIRQETQTMAQQQGGIYSGITYDSTSNVTTQPLVVGGTLRLNQRNPYNGAIVITPVTSDTQLSISFAGISQAGCVKLIQAINNPNEIVSVQSTGGTVTTFPMTAATAATTCSGVTNTIVWTLP